MITIKLSVRCSFSKGSDHSSRNAACRSVLFGYVQTKSRGEGGHVVLSVNCINRFLYSSFHLQFFCCENKSQHVFSSFSNLHSEKLEFVPCVFLPASGLILSVHIPSAEFCWIVLLIVIIGLRQHCEVGLLGGRRGMDTPVNLYHTSLLAKGTKLDGIRAKSAKEQEIISCQISKLITHHWKRMAVAFLPFSHRMEHPYGKHNYQNLQRTVTNVLIIIFWTKLDIAQWFCIYRRVQYILADLVSSIINTMKPFILFSTKVFYLQTK